MENPAILHAEPDIVSLIFSYIILDLDQFSTFSKLLIVWEREKPSAVIKYVLERLNWDKLYAFHQHPMEVTRDQFHGFIIYAVRHRVTQALFYNSSQKLFLRENIQHHLGVLRSLAGNHFPSSSSYLFFKAIFRPFEIDETAKQMSNIINQKHLRGKMLEIMCLLEDIYIRLFENDYLLPVYKFCPNARNRDLIYQLDGEPFAEELWCSLCDKAVEENEVKEFEKYEKSIQLNHIWNSDCDNCSLQLILFKVLLGAIPY